jgi:sarcosine oxidase, subunit delta
MKLLNCPINGVRPISEFVYGGEYRDMPNPDKSDDKAWASYVHYRDNAPGLKKEWWYHTPSGTWFIAERNTLTDEVMTTYLLNSAAENKKANESLEQAE